MIAAVPITTLIQCCQNNLSDSATLIPAGASSDTVTIVGGVLGALVALLLAYSVVATIVIAVMMHRNRRGKVSIKQHVYAG